MPQAAAKIHEILPLFFYGNRRPAHLARDSICEENESTAKPLEVAGVP
jgi:hypothetical protein